MGKCLLPGVHFSYLDESYIAAILFFIFNITEKRFCALIWPKSLPSLLISLAHFFFGILVDFYIQILETVEKWEDEKLC